MGMYEDKKKAIKIENRRKKIPNYMKPNATSLRKDNQNGVNNAEEKLMEAESKRL